MKVVAVDAELNVFYEDSVNFDRDLLEYGYVPIRVCVCVCVWGGGFGVLPQPFTFINYTTLVLHCDL